MHASSSIISNLFFCFIANITATISSEVPSLGKGRHHILLLGELFPQISSFYMIFESTPHFFNCHMWMFPFWKHLIAFFRNKRWKVIGFTEGSMWRTRIPTVLLLCLSKEQRFFYLLSKLIILQKQRFSFLWKNRNIVLFVNSLQKRKAQESINKVSVELLIEQN